MWKICIINGNNYQRAKTGAFRGYSVPFTQNPALGFFELILPKSGRPNPAITCQRV
jgi:hypothetical protein